MVSLIAPFASSTGEIYLDVDNNMRLKIDKSAISQGVADVIEKK